LTVPQLRHAADVLAERGHAEAATRARVAIRKHIADGPGR
jgi:hypothetical protein